MPLAELLADLRADTRFMANVAAWRTQPAAPPRYGPTPRQLHPRLTTVLAERGISQLYTHQSRCVEGALAGRNMAVVTPTASGKTLCYNLPVLHALLTEADARALYLFPTKALAHDQLNELYTWQTALQESGNAILPLEVAAYDGDTPAHRRAPIRQQSRLILSNPDMLHVGILPNHMQWEHFFAGLRYVVIDEMHVYRGVFGSHVANVLRRLRRICAFYGSHPQFICASATIANPQELAQQLVEAPVEVIDETGAPQGEKHIILYNPSIFDEERGLRRSSTLEAQELAARCVLAGQQTIVFGRARLTTELLLGYLRDRLRRELDTRTVGQGNGRVDEVIRGYRGGYLPQERRAIEAGLRNGSVRAVVATNALELGIDIGQLQAAILCGYPGSIAATWQQMGRAGRTTEASLAMLVATGGALDQYVIRNPRFIFERSPEHALINPDNLMLLVDQMRCAAFELPFTVDEMFGASVYTPAVLELLVEQGELHPQGTRFFWGGLSQPARTVSLRTAGNDTVVIQTVGRRAREGRADDSTPPSVIGNSTPPSVIGELERAAAVSLLHDGAIYWHEGRSFVVEELDLAQNLAHVRPQETDYYTQVMGDAEIEILARHEARESGGATVAHGDLRVSNQVLGYRRVRRFTHETVGVYPLDYPPTVIETTGYWVQVSSTVQAALEAAGQWYDSVNDYGPNWAEQRAKVRARDGYRCSQCGAPEAPGRQHDVHHLQPFRTFGYVRGVNENWREANRLSNLTLVCRVCHQRLESSVRVRTGLDGVAYALNNLAPLYLMCDPQDLGVHVTRGDAATPRLQNVAQKAAAPPTYATAADVAWTSEPDPAAGDESTADSATAGSVPALPAIYLYERIAAGLGFSARLYELHTDLVRGAQQLIRACNCPSGCPACVGPVLDDAPALLETKRLALALLDALAGEEVAA